MGFWHTGYIEFHQPTGLEGFEYQPPPPTRYVCEHCTQQFDDVEALRRHRFESHPLRQPVLLLRGRPVGALPIKILTPLAEREVVVEEATDCVLNGRSVEPHSLGTVLSTMSREFVELTIRNGGAATRCELDFAIADEVHLRGVESAFLRVARDRVLSIDAIARFVRDCRALGTAMPYCDGICHYLYGVMAKEQSADSGLERNQYVDRFVRSSDELSGFDRSLARSVRALIAFHFNQFDEAEALAPEGALRHAARAFAGLLLGLPWHFDAAFSSAPASAVEDLLTDQDTLQVLADARHGIFDLKNRADDLVAHLRRASPGGYDRMKRILLAAEALAAREDEASQAAARRYARELASQPDANAWAEAMMNRLKTR